MSVIPCSFKAGYDGQDARTSLKRAATRRSAPTCVVGGVLAAASIGSVAVADFGPPVATFTYQIDGAAPVSTEVVGVVLSSGNAIFNKTFQVGQFKVIFNYNADLNPAGIVSFNGTTTVENNSASTAQFSTEFRAPICPKIVGSSNIGGSTTVKLTANADGGALTCDSSQPWLTAAMTNGVWAKKLYFCPFSMGKTGSGSTTTNLTWGTPIPSAPGPVFIDDIGHTTNFSLTSGDKVVFTLIFAANGPVDDPLLDPCAGDVDGNGVVDKDDLIMVLMTFGQAADCGDQVDTNGDGLVDGADLSEILSYWGDCPKG